VAAQLRRITAAQRNSPEASGGAVELSQASDGSSDGISKSGEGSGSLATNSGREVGG
jgi:hypothetical protein